MNTKKRKCEDDPEIDVKPLKLKTIDENNHDDTNASDCDRSSCSNSASEQKSDNGGASEQPGPSENSGSPQIKQESHDNESNDSVPSISEIKTEVKTEDENKKKEGGILLFSGGTNWDLIGRKELPKNAMARPANPSPQQFELLLGELEVNPHLISGRVDLGNNYKAKLANWEKLADVLNAVGSGCRKGGKQWQKTWQDWRGRVRKRAQQVHSSAKETGGGRPIRPLDELELRLLALIDESITTGLRVPCSNHVPALQSTSTSEEHEPHEELEVVITPDDVNLTQIPLEVAIVPSDVSAMPPSTEVLNLNIVEACQPVLSTPRHDKICNTPSASQASSVTAGYSGGTGKCSLQTPLKQFPPNKKTKKANKTCRFHQTDVGAAVDNFSSVQARSAKALEDLAKHMESIAKSFELIAKYFTKGEPKNDEDEDE